MTRKLEDRISDIPKDANADLLLMDQRHIAFRKKRNTRLCWCCYEFATKIVSYDYHGARLIEKYCDIQQRGLLKVYKNENSVVYRLPRTNLSLKEDTDK
jgi:hypothetical protein